MDHPEKQDPGITQTLKEFEDTKGAIRIRISTKNRQHNDQKMHKRTNKRRTPFYLYIQSSPVRVLAVIEENNIRRNYNSMVI